MIRQYGAATHRRECVGGRVRAVGTIPIGEIVYIQDCVGPFGPPSRYFQPERRNPWIVECWHPRELCAAAWQSGSWVSRYLTGGHLATVRSLRDGRRAQVADWLLLASSEAGGHHAN